MADLEDKYYYKIKSIQSEIEYVADAIKKTENGLAGIVQNASKRETILKLLAKAQVDIKSIQDATSPIFRPEF